MFHRRRHHSKHPISIAVAGLAFFFFGEFFFYQEARLLSTLQDELAAVDVDPDRFDASLRGELIHMTGEVRVNSGLSDTYFPVDLRAAVLERHVQTYDDDKWIDVAAHEPSPRGYYPETYINESTSIGLFEITEDALERGYYAERVELDDGFYEQLPRRSREAITKIDNNKIYFAQRPDRDTPGDERIYFDAMIPGTYSLLAAQSNMRLIAYALERDGQGDMFVSSYSPKKYALVLPGKASPQEIVDAHKQQAMEDLSIVGLPLRGISWFLIFLGVLFSLIRHDLGASLPGLGQNKLLSALVVTLPMTAGTLAIAYGAAWYGIVLTYTMVGVGLGLALIIGAFGLAFFDPFSSPAEDDPDLDGSEELIFPTVNDQGPAQDLRHQPAQPEQPEQPEQPTDDQVRDDLVF